MKIFVTAKPRSREENVEEIDESNFNQINSGYLGALKMTILEELIHSTQENLQQINKEAVIQVNSVNEELAKIKFIKPQKMQQNITKSDSKEEVTMFDLDMLDGFKFEDFIAGLLRINNYSGVEVTRKSRDQGADILASKENQRYVIQAKRYSIDKKVGNSAIQAALGAIGYYNADIGAVVTNSFFTNSAKELAKANGIILWDRLDVSKFLEKYTSQKTPI